MSSLRDKVIVITGGGGTIAGAVGQAYLDAGARLVLVDRELVRIQGLGRSFNSPVIEADLRSFDEAQRMLEEIKGQVGRIDGLIHLVGDVVTGRVVELDAAAYDMTFDSNMRTLFNAVKVVLPEMLRRNEGFIAGIASWGSRHGGSADASLFSASKSAVESFLRALDAELESTAIDVAIIFPLGAVDTSSNRRQFREIDEKRLISPQAIAQALVAAHGWEGQGRLLEVPIYPPRG